MRKWIFWDLNLPCSICALTRSHVYAHTFARLVNLDYGGASWEMPALRIGSLIKVYHNSNGNNNTKDIAYVLEIISFFFSVVC